MTATDQRIEQALATEMVRSERLRAILLLGLFGAMAVAAGAMAVTQGDILVLVTGKEALGNLAPMGLTLVLGIEGAMALYFHRLLKTSRVPRPWVLPTVTVIELAMPTLMLSVK